MQALFDAINAICAKIQVISDLFWDFPANFTWYSSIPVLGNFSLAIILLLGTGIYFTCKLRFVQVRYFGHGIRVLKDSKSAQIGISSLAAFFLSPFSKVSVSSSG